MHMLTNSKCVYIASIYIKLITINKLFSYLVFIHEIYKQLIQETDAESSGGKVCFFMFINTFITYLTLLLLTSYTHLQSYFIIYKLYGIVKFS